MTSLSARKAALLAGLVASLPAIAYVTTHSTHRWPAMLALGAACAVAAGLCFGVYFRFANALVQRRTLGRRMRVAAVTAPAGMLVDPLDEAERELEARFAELERRERH